MNNSSANLQSSKSDPRRKAIASLIFGISSMIVNASIIIVYFGIMVEGGGGLRDLLGEITGYITSISLAWPFLLISPGWLFPIIGFLLGIMGLKSTKKSFAIGGIALSIIGLGIFIYLFLIGLRIGTA